MNKKPSQKERLLIAIIYVIIIFILSKIFFPYDGIFPPSGQKWLWLWVALFTLIFSQFLDQPHFVAPVNAFLNSIAGLLAVREALSSNSEILLSQTNHTIWIGATFIFSTTIFISAFAILFKDAQSIIIDRFAKGFTRISKIFGSAQFVFTIIFLVAVRSFHADSSRDTFWLLSIWGLVVFTKPVERYLPRLRKIIPEFLESIYGQRKLGVVISRREPNIVTIKLLDEIPNINTLLLIFSDNGYCQLAITFDNFELAGERWARAMLLDGFKKLPQSILKNINGNERDAFKCNLAWLNEDTKKLLQENDLYRKKNKFIGLVAEGSNVSTINIELLRNDQHIEEGQLLDIKIGKKDILFQIIDGLTNSEILQTSNRHGYVEIKARKLGEWGENDVLIATSWLPDIYSPVYFRKPTHSKFNNKFIGYIPQSNYGLSVDCHNLVSHNTAILGVLGSGKTRLALELIGRMLNNGIHVWVIDITGRYIEDLKDLLDHDEQTQLRNKIVNDIKDKELFVYSNKEYGGNKGVFRTIVREYLNEFVNKKDASLYVFEPNEYRITEQVTDSRRTKIEETDSSTNKVTEKWIDTAGHGLLTSAQITRIITEELLRCTQSMGISDQAKVCLVFEEAHSLVPEWNVVASDGDGRATNATAKAILQGRKYGLGCLLITQRTAHVTKSILNQCHTIFALQTFDKTGMDFLSNYIGDDYTNLLSGLKTRHCVAYGKALNSGTPLLVELNEHPNSGDVAKKFIEPTDTQDSN